MTETFPFFKQRSIQILFAIYAISIPYWAWIQVTGQINTPHNYIWSLIVLGILPVIGGIFGIILSRKWGFLKASLGRAIFFLSAGVMAWGIGSVIWAYYNLVLGVEVPYPSFGDVGYLMSYPFYALGLINLGKGMGAYHKLKTRLGKVALVLVPVLGMAVTYFIFISIARGGEFDYQDSSLLKILFDIGYPLGDATVVTAIGLIYGLSYKVFGGKFKWPINLLFAGQLLLYFGDFFFSYGTTQGTYYIGNLNDLLFVHALFLIAVGVNALNIPGISSRVRDELVMFAPRATEAVNKLVLEIIQRQSHIIGTVAWEEATKVPGLTIDVKNNKLSVDGDPKIVLEQLVGRYEGLFGNASLEICREAARKMVSQLPPEQIPAILK